MLPIPFNHFGQGEPFTPPDIINGRYWALPPTGLNAKTAAVFTKASSEYLEDASGSVDFQVGDEDFSFGCWVRIQSATVATEIFMSRFLTAGNNRSFQLYRQATDNSLVAYITNDGGITFTIVDSDVLLSTTDFRFAAATYDSVNDLFKVVYLNESGTPNAMRAASHLGGAYAASTAKFRIGANEDGSFFGGNIDGAFFSKKRFSMAEFLAIYNGDVGLPIADWATTGGLFPIARYFDGASAFDINSVLPSIATDTVGSISFWAKPLDSTPAAREEIVAYSNVTASDNVFFNVEDGSSGQSGSLRAGLTIGGVPQWSFRTTNKVFNDNFWTHIVVTQDGVLPQIYVNGVLASITQLVNLDVTKWFTDVPLITHGRIGSIFVGAEFNHFIGSVDEVNIWSRDLSAIEAAQVHSTGGTYDNFTAGLLTGLSASFNMNEDAGTNLVDRVSSFAGVEIGLPVESEGPPGACDTTVTAGDLTTNFVSHYGMEEEAGTRFDGFGSNDLTDNNTVNSGGGKVIDPILDAQKIFSITDQFGGIVQGTQETYPDRPLLTGGKIVLDGTDYIDITQVLSLVISDTVGTWAMFVRPVSGTPATNQMLLSFNDTNGDRRIDLTMRPSGKLRFTALNVGVVEQFYESDAAHFVDNTWIHVGVVHDGISPTLYVNGLSVAATQTGADATVWMSKVLSLENGRIGCIDYFNNGPFLLFEGEYHELQIYSTAATPGQMLQLATYNVP